MQFLRLTTVGFIAASFLLAGNDEENRLKAATETLTEMASGGDKAIPSRVLKKPEVPLPIETKERLYVSAHARI